MAGDDAIAAGWLDETVSPEDVISRAQVVAGEAAKLDVRAHLASKRKARESAVRAILAGL